jgi:hypothetical protein
MGDTGVGMDPLRVAVAKVAQKRDFHHDFCSFLIPIMHTQVSNGAMPPSEILGKTGHLVPLGEAFY